MDFSERKGAAWGASGLCLHVNQLNVPALRFYDSLGFRIVPDWYGFNNQRFLLHKPLRGEEPEVPPPVVVAAPRSDAGNVAPSGAAASSVDVVATPPRGDAGDEPVSVAAARIKAELSPLATDVFVNGGTEPLGYAQQPGGLAYELEQSIGTAFPSDGGFRCVRCGSLLYWAPQKFPCGCGWPAFDDAVAGAVEERPEKNDPLSSSLPKYGVEAVCRSCGGHLGHVIRGEGLTPTDARHCVNGVCLAYDGAVEAPADVVNVVEGAAV